MAKEHQIHNNLEDSTPAIPGDIATELEQLIAANMDYAAGVMDVYERTERYYRATHDRGTTSAGFSGTANWTS